MDRRFGVRELIVSGLLVVLIVLVLLAMKQYDRQWQVLSSIDKQLREQTRELARVRGALAGGAATMRSAPATEVTAGSDPFYRMKEAQAKSDYALGDYLVTAFGVVPDRLTPLVSQDYYASTVQGYVLESLLQRDPDTFEWKPFIATGWRTTDNQTQWKAYVDKRLAVALTEEEVRREKAFPRDGDVAAQQQYVQQRLKEGRRLYDVVREAEAPAAVVMDFDIRPGVTFSDGEPLTVDDVVFTFDWIMNEEVQAPRDRAYYEKVKRVVKVDEDTVRFEFNEPYFLAVNLAGGLPILPKHFYGRFTPTEFNRSTGLLMGSGPYRLEDPESWKPEPGKPIELVRNERYWGEPGPFEKMVWRIIENDAARLTAFRNGETDAFGATPEQYVALKDDPQINARAQRFEFEEPEGGFIYIGWGQERQGRPTRFADKRVRQAMTMLTDRERIVKELMRGYGRAITGPFSPLTPQYDASIRGLPFDPGAAKALLAEAGYTDRNGDGVLEGADGQPFRFKLAYGANSDFGNQLVLFLKDSYAKAGVVLEPEPLEWSVLLKRLDDRDLDAVTMSWSGTIEFDPYQIFHSSQIHGVGDNFVSYRNPELDRLIEQARTTVEEKARMPLWHQVQRILNEDQPYTFVSGRMSLAFYDRRIQNIVVTRLGLNSRLEWYVPAGLQKWTKGE